MASLVFMGTPEFAVPSLKALFEAGHEIKFVITQPDKPKGRGHVMAAPPVKEFALSKGLRVLQPTRLRDENFIAELRRARPEFLIVVAYGKILTEEVLAVPSIAPINLHASLLPKYRGAAPIPWAIINGEKETGVTTMIITKELDSGDVLLTERVAITDDDTAESLSRKLSAIGAELLVRTIDGMLKGTVRPTPQKGEPTYVPQIKKSDGRINWSKTAKELFNFVRGMYPWPGAYTEIDGEIVTLIKTRPLQGTGKGGQIERITKDSIIVGTKDGLLEILELKPSGRRAMSAGEFLRGRAITPGMRFK